MEREGRPRAIARGRPYTSRMLPEGTPAPDFTLPDQDGEDLSLADLRGRWVVLWWYPKASTAG
jgi:peroxiredoxin Q/BCP